MDKISKGSYGFMVIYPNGRDASLNWEKGTGEKGTGVINSRVNRADGTKELESQRRSVQHGGPYGSELCSQQIFALLGLESSLRLRGRPRKPLRSPGNDSRPLLLISRVTTRPRPGG